MRVVRIIAALAAAVLPGAAHVSTQEATREQPASRVYPSVFVTTDYRYNGMSLSDGGPALQASLYWWQPDDFYAGVWASQVDFDFPGGPSIEVDVYAGRRFHRGATVWRVEAMYSWFDYHAPGPTLNFFQSRVEGARTVGAWTLALEGTWSPEGSFGAGTTWKAIGHVSRPLRGRLTASGRFGYAWIDHRADRAYWDAGLTYRWRRLAVDLRYVDSNASFGACSFRDWCDAGVTGTVSLDLPYLEFSRR